MYDVWFSSMQNLHTFFDGVKRIHTRTHRYFIKMHFLGYLTPKKCKYLKPEADKKLQLLLLLLLNTEYTKNAKISKCKLAKWNKTTEAGKYTICLAFFQIVTLRNSEHWIKPWTHLGIHSQKEIAICANCLIRHFKYLYHWPTSPMTKIDSHSRKNNYSNIKLFFLNVMENIYLKGYFCNNVEHFCLPSLEKK